MLDKKQLRLASCVETILEIHTLLEIEILDQSLIGRFKDLEQSLKDMEVDYLTETDITLIEGATNRLLDELKILFSNTGADPIHSGAVH